MQFGGLRSGGVAVMMDTYFILEKCDADQCGTVNSGLGA